ncbi:MAG: FtsK/SpoIIIE domain-containing protein [Roseburia sp.]|nr:FtsK/SpoIIIE domain-containing protein [Roseburia sp.]
MKRKELFKSMTTIKDFTKDENGHKKVKINNIKEEVLTKIPLAIFFNCCEKYSITYNECLLLIQVLATKTFRNSGKNLFLNEANKEKMISIWEIMKKLYTHKLCLNYLKKDLLYLRNASLCEDNFFSMLVKLGKSKNLHRNSSKSLDKSLYHIPYNILDEVEVDKDFFIQKACINLPLGVDKNKKVIYADLYKLKHLLLSGATKSGKSICLHTILTSLLSANHPLEFKLILIDFKGVEFTVYKDLPHLAMPILTDSKSAVAALKWITSEIESRSQYLEFEEYLSSFPTIVIVIDEYLDLVMDYNEEATKSLSLIVQKGAQVGIHIILSTARPTRDIISNTLKASISNRIAFRVTTYIDSEVIIDKRGAELLKGRGEMIFKKEDTYIPLQGIYIKEDLIERICMYIRENYSQEYLLNQQDLDKIEVKAPKKEIIDEKLLYEVALYCIEQGIVNINSIQLKFFLRFNVVVAILQELEKRGIVSPKQGVYGRTILVDKQKLKDIIKVE